MKLNTDQIEEIEKYILDWEIEYKEFFDEILDHFITSIEQRMDDGEEFYNAFHSVVYTFSGKEFQKTKIDTYYGLKAFEMEHLNLYEKELMRDLKKTILKQFTTFRILIWVLFCFSIFTFTKYIEQFWLMVLAIYFIQTIVILYLTKPKFSLKKLLPSQSQSIEFKKKNLKSTFKVGAISTILMGISLLTINIFNLTNGYSDNSESNSVFKKIMIISFFIFSISILEILFKILKKVKLFKL